MNAIEAFLSAQERAKFSYSELESTRHGAPAGYTVDHNRVRLGDGREIFRRSVEALQRWEMFNLGWVKLFRPNTPIEANATVAVLARHFGFWSLNACRIVYVFHQERSYGFAYGTLEDHVEQGEERFSVDWSLEDDAVYYDILALSRPNQWQAKIVPPLSRMLQKRFARDSKAAMMRAVRER